MQQYLSIVDSILEQGTWVKNERTNSNCLVLLNQTFKGKASIPPVLTSRKINWKGAINEMVCYIRGYTSLKDFHKLGVKTWDANCEAWNSPHKLDENDLGLIYGASARKCANSFSSVIKSIRENPYDRGHIWNFYNPALFPLGCLRPCMFNHQFNVLGDTIHLTSTQRSADFLLGSSWNIIQCWFLLNVVANLTGFKAGTFTLNMANCHIYENQIEAAKELLSRKLPAVKPVITGVDKIDREALFNGNPTDLLTIEHYYPNPTLKIPFTV